MRCSSVLILCLLCGCVDSSKQNEAPVPTAPAASKPSGGSGPGATDPDAPKAFTELTGGLKYRLLRKTSGAKPKASDTVLCHYKGTLDNGEVFDSSYKRGEPTEFPLRGVIPGWTIGLQHCPVGGMIELEVPSEMGYGADGMPPVIPGGATLHFIVELIEIR